MMGGAWEGRNTVVVFRSSYICVINVKIGKKTTLIRVHNNPKTMPHIKKQITHTHTPVRPSIS